ncbi:hypothetical protein [Polyangium sp. 15x6]|uniref:hypothetical protein n=1 Tax=Polyangium sp. 15x6 TaxID=3042687 RepID=UPI00249C8BFA|nr:hypothetical protein [Polyangium sp. 15x6]MDI3291755.1 hypothetical protein [Polyangium sp. 15x6]
MSVNFYNNLAIMAGIDLHDFYPPGVVDERNAAKFWPYAVGAPFWWPAAWVWGRTGTVTADGWQMIDEDFSLFLVPHTHIVGVPGPMQAMQYAKILGPSGSEPALTIRSVTVKGAPLAACIHGAVGLNLNCWEDGDHPSGLVLSVTSVKTTATLGDVVAGIVKWVSVGLIAPQLGKLAGRRYTNRAARRLLKGVNNLDAPPKWLRKIAAKPKAIIEFAVEQATKRVLDPLAKKTREMIEGEQQGR